MKKILLLLFLLLSSPCFAGNEDISSDENYKENSYSSISLTSRFMGKNKGILSLHLTLAPEWKTFWKQPGDAGNPLSVNWEGSENIADVQLKWATPTRFIDEVSDEYRIEVLGYKEAVELPLEIIPMDPQKEALLKLHIEYMVCNKLCIPQEASFTMQLPAFATFQDSRSEDTSFFTPANNGSFGLTIREVYLTATDLVVVGHSKQGFTAPDVFIDGMDGIHFAKPNIETKDGETLFRLPYDIYLPDTTLEGQPLEVVLKDGSVSVTKTVTVSFQKEAQESPISLAYLMLPLIFGFIGGLILNIMPCVLPVISLKLLSVIKDSGRDPRQIKMSFIASALGIITSFWGLALLTITFKYAGFAVGWGIHFQQPVFIISLTMIVALFSANLWDIYEIPLPQWAGALALKNKSDGLLGHFITGVFTTLLATPCSAPFLGTAVGFALSNGWLEILLIFTAMGLGLSFPFLIIAIHPEFVARLPKPGKWMIRVKHFLGTILALTALWLIWVLAHQIGNTVAWIMIGIFVTLMATLHFLSSTKLKFLSIVLLFFAAISLTFVFDSSKNSSEKQYAEFWQPFDQTAIASQVEEGKVVFVTVTADWCITCKANKLLVLNSDTVQSLLKNDGVVAMMADWTNPNEKITQYLQENDKFGIPFNIVYSKKHPDGIVLSELLTEAEVLKALGEALSSQ